MSAILVEVSARNLAFRSIYFAICDLTLHFYKFFYEVPLIIFQTYTWQVTVCVDVLCFDFVCDDCKKFDFIILTCIFVGDCCDFIRVIYVHLSA